MFFLAAFALLCTLATIRISSRFDPHSKSLSYLCNSLHGSHNINGYLCPDMKTKKGYTLKMYLHEMTRSIELL